MPWIIPLTWYVWESGERWGSSVARRGAARGAMVLRHAQRLPHLLHPQLPRIVMLLLLLQLLVAC